MLRTRPAAVFLSQTLDGFIEGGGDVHRDALGEAERVRDVLLLDGGPAHYGVPEYRAAKTETDVYVEYGTGEREFYLATEDPFQLDSRHNDPAQASVMEERAAQVEALYGCPRYSCRLAEAQPPPEAAAP